MDDTEWRHLIHKTAGKMIYIADSLGVLNTKFDSDLTIDETIKKMEEIFKAVLNENVAYMSETLPECPRCGESGVFDCRTVIGFRYICSHCDNTWNITEKEFSGLIVYDGVNKK